MGAVTVLKAATSTPLLLDTFNRADSALAGSTVSSGVRTWDALSSGQVVGNRLRSGGGYIDTGRVTNGMTVECDFIYATANTGNFADLYVSLDTPASLTSNKVAVFFGSGITMNVAGGGDQDTGWVGIPAAGTVFHLTLSLVGTLMTATLTQSTASFTSTKTGTTGTPFAGPYAGVGLRPNGSAGDIQADNFTAY